MLGARLIAGTAFALGLAAVLVVDTWLAQRYGSRVYPCLLACGLLLGLAAARELIALMPEAGRPAAVVCLPGVLLILTGNWFFPFLSALRIDEKPYPLGTVSYLVAASVAALFAYEMARFRGADGAAARVARGVFVLVYLGYLPGFLIRLRWLDYDPLVSSLMLAAAIFVPKVGDIGAYFTGKALGHRPMAPLLSPKKTWEGFAGGLAASALTAVGLSFADPRLFPNGVVEAVGFGLVLGLVGVFGDLTESLLKRDFGAKDAGRSVPGFGGVLDVIDSVIFAGPVAYLWFWFNMPR
jgi:phosphatidate cytidylyltransferase